MLQADDTFIDLFVEDDYIVLDSCADEQSDTVSSQARQVMSAPMRSTASNRRSRGKGKRGGVARQLQKGGVTKQQQYFARRRGAALRKIQALKFKQARAKVAQAREVKMLHTLVVKAEPENPFHLSSEQYTSAHHEAWPTTSPYHTASSMHYATDYDTGFGASGDHYSVNDDQSYGAVSDVRSPLLGESSSTALSSTEGDLRPLIQQSQQNKSGLTQDELFLPLGSHGDTTNTRQKTFDMHTLPFSGFDDMNSSFVSDTRPLSSYSSRDVISVQTDRPRSYSGSHDLANSLLFNRSTSEPSQFNARGLKRPLPIHSVCPSAAASSSIHSVRPPAAVSSSIHSVRPPVAASSSIHSMRPPAAASSSIHPPVVGLGAVGPQYNTSHMQVNRGLHNEQLAVDSPYLPPVAKGPLPVPPAKSWRKKKKKSGMKRLAPSRMKFSKVPPKPVTTVYQKPPGSQSRSVPTATSSVIQCKTLEQAVTNIANRIQQTLSHPSLQSPTPIKPSDTNTSDVNPSEPSPADPNSSVADLLAKINGGISSFIAASKQITESLDSLNKFLSENL